MPGRSHRYKLWEHFQPPDPPRPLAPEQLIHFQHCLIGALVFRLAKASPKEERAARIGLKLSFKMVKVLVNTLNVGDEKAFGMAASIVATMPEKKILAMLKFLEHRNPVALFAESIHILEEVERLPRNDARQKWLRSLGLFSENEIDELYCDRPAELVEAVLARRHGTNKGKIHKLLAEAASMFKDYRDHSSSRRPSH